MLRKASSGSGGGIWTKVLAKGVGGGEKTGQFRRPETSHRRVKGEVERAPAGTLGVEVPRTSAAMI